MIFHQAWEYSRRLQDLHVKLYDAANEMVRHG